MAITLRSRREIDLIRRAGSVVAGVLLKLKELAVPGVTTAELDEVALEMTAAAGAHALFKGVKNPYGHNPFPGAICASLNEQIVHGIPSAKCKLSDGDILSVDFGVKLDGYCGDAAVTIGVGQVSAENLRLIDVTKAVLEIATSQAAPGARWSQIAGKMQRYAEKAGFSVVKDFVGHGIGTEMHAEPSVPNFVSRSLRNNDIYLAPGMVLAVEPMINAGSDGTKILKDGWTVATKDGKNSAHFEHTIVVTEEGCEVLTLQ
ncbi:type I methionyl aminopeptidase [Planctomycetota bacterium]